MSKMQYDYCELAPNGNARQIALQMTDLYAISICAHLKNKPMKGMISMPKQFVAYGTLYKAGDKIGSSDFSFNTDREAMKGAVSDSADKLPVTVWYGFNGAENVIGFATLSIEDDRIIAKITFNSIHQKAYESLLQTDDGRNNNRLGFCLQYQNVDPVTMTIDGGRFDYITLNPKNLGGIIDHFGWEDE